MNSIKETLEIIRPVPLEIDPRFVRATKPMFDAMLNGGMRPEVEEDNHASGWFALKSKGYRNRSLKSAPEKKEDLIVTDDPKWDMTAHWWDEEGPLISPEDEFINVIDITSSVTRNGGWCSAGSIEHRDQMIFASRFPNCIGHVFIVDTPGGSAFSKNDYQQGIAAARAAGQPVITWIDGMCCSAGVAASCQTDEIYVMHENDEVGCIGTMAAFYTLADGTQDGEGYVYHELYDPESFEKNLEFRELANNNNADPILADLAEDGAAFRALVKENRPGMSEDMLHGKVFKARELMGTLVDGVMTFEQVIDRIVAIRQGAPLVAHVVDVVDEGTENTDDPAAPEGKCGDPDKDKCGDPDKDKCGDDDKNAAVPPAPCDDDDDDDDEPCDDDDKEKCGDDKDKCGDPDKDKCGDDKDNKSAAAPVKENTHINNNKNMKQYENINAALDVEAIAVTEDGSFYCNGALAEALDAHLAKAAQNASLLAANNETVRVLNEKVKSLNEAQTALNEQVATLTQEKQTLEAEVANLNSQIVNLNSEKEALVNEKTQLETSHGEKVNEMTAQADSEKEALNITIAEKDQKIADLEAELAGKNAEVEELAKQTPAAPAPAPAAAEEAPKSNSLHFYEGCKTSADRAKALEETMKSLRQ